MGFFSTRDERFLYATVGGGLGFYGSASEDGKVHTVEQEQEGVEDVVEIKEKPLDIMRYNDAVRDSSAGAIATFTGTTRDTFQGQEVLELRYEAY